MVGHRLLVGITERDEAGRIIERRQFAGTVREITDGVVTVERDGVRLALPADPGAYERARPGSYRLPDGTVVVDPDYLGLWEIVRLPDVEGMPDVEGASPTPAGGGTTAGPTASEEGGGRRSRSARG